MDTSAKHITERVELISGTRSQDRTILGGGTGWRGPKSTAGVCLAMLFLDLGASDTRKPISGKFMELYVDNFSPLLYVCDLHKLYKDRNISKNDFKVIHYSNCN